MTVAIIDYGVGNLTSVVNAFTAVGAEFVVVSSSSELAGHDGLVLPGVGAFAMGMANLAERGLVEPIRREVLRGTPFLGFCLGLQLLAESSEEYGQHPGLGLIKGVVRPLRPDPALRLRLPHIGWNDVTLVQPHGAFRGMGDSACFYFVHSFALEPLDSDIVAGTCDYGGSFVAAIQTRNITATQFHPEKSHKAGLQILKNWLGGPC